MIRAICLNFLTLLVVLSCSQVKQVTFRNDVPNAIPELRITNDTTASPIQISSLDIDISVAANIAITTFDIVFYNPNNRILEGELEFPLADGQTIIRYALDIDGKLREGVVVEKKIARVAFENTIRRKIDPGLVEKTKGNNFRTRIYPLPSNGTRHIIIAIEQTLELLDKDLFYQLPLKSSEIIKKFSVKASVIKNTEKPRLEENKLTNFEFNKQEGDWLAAYSQDNFLPNHTVAFTIPNSSKDGISVLVENAIDNSYFYVNSRIAADYKKKTSPQTIGVFWDISASGEKRDIQKEKQLLKEYLSQLGNVKLSLISFNIFEQDREEFEITGGNIDKLFRKIDQFVYDGGTQLGAIDFTKFNFDEAFLFSDGLSTFGKKEMVLSSIPIITINSSPSADFSVLKFIALQTHGKFIDLSKLELKTAIDEINGQSLQIIRIDYNPAEIEDLVVQNGPIQNSGLSFAGKLKTSFATVKIELGFGNEIKTTKTFIITKPGSSDHDNVKRIWAEMKIAELDLQFEKNKEDITSLGKRFSIVTQNTSLIVLDRVEDYVEHEITPPEELQKEYFTLLKEKKEIEKNSKATALDDALDAMEQLKEWWQKNYSPVKEKAILTDTLITRNNAPTVEYQQTVIVPDALADSLVSGNGAMNFSISAGVGRFSASDSSGVTLSYSNLSLADGDLDGVDERLEEEKKATAPNKPEIQINKWKADATYLKDLEKVKADQWKSKYYSLKKQYLNQPSFFIDVARFFIEKNETLFGLLVLSNAAEMKLEDAELLRMVANQLLEANEKDLAIETFREILKMREEEPHSHRDLALALSESGNYNEAVNQLYKVITGSWDGRFGDIKAIVINEMNAIISAHKDQVNTSAVDTRFIYPMPVDVRIVIGWNTDNSDVDLWVTDPRNEKCFYSHSETGIGGKISRDITGGYGPEEFQLKKALQGNYKIEVNLFGDSRQTMGGPISIKAEMFTDFGKPSQKREVINFRVTTNSEVVKIGSLKFGH